MKIILPIVISFLAPLALLSAGTKDYSKLFINPAAFTENKGQLRDMNGNPVDYVMAYYSVPGLTLYITDKGVTYVIEQSEVDSAAHENPALKTGKKSKVDYSRVDADLDGADIHAENLKFTDELQSRSNYYKSADGKGQLAVPHYKTLTISNVYPGIDWVWKCNGANRLEYDFVVHAGADASRIKMNYKFAGLVPGTNKLSIVAKYGKITEGPLQAYNEKGKVSVAYRFDKSANSIQFDAGDYDRGSDLIIDPPLQLEWSAEFGGSFQNGLSGVATDSNGYIYLVGYTNSPDFPTLNAGGTSYFDGTYNGSGDAIILKIDSSENLLWSTFFGGSGTDYANSVAVDAGNHIYVTGTAQTGFPIVNYTGAYNQSTCIDQDAFISAFTPELSLTWSTFFGGNGDNEALKIYSDPNYGIFVSGYTNATGNSFPTYSYTGNYVQSYSGGGYDAFILNFFTRYDFGQLRWSTLYGGSGDDYATSVTTNTNNGNVFVCGFTGSDNILVPDYTGSYHQSNNGGGTDGFILEYYAYYYTLWQASYYGGSGTDYLTDIATGTNNTVICTGSTNSTNFPLKTDDFAYYQGSLAGGYDAVIVQFDDSLRQMWSTYYGGSGTDVGTALACDNNGRIYLTGFTFSTNFPLDSPRYAGAYYQPNNRGVSNGFLAGFSSLGARFWSTYKGDSCYQYPQDIAYDNKFNQFYVVGEGLLNCESLPDTNQVNNNGVSTLGFCWGFDNGAAGNGNGGPPGCYTVTLSGVTVACPGQCNGTATANYTGGTPPYSVIWTDGDTTNTTRRLCAGEQWVEVQDAAGCVGQAQIDNYSLYVSAPGWSLNCSGYGTADVDAEEGNQPYSYLWSDGTTTSYDNNITAGYYIVTVTDAAGCTDTAGFNAVSYYDEGYSIQVIQNPTCGQDNGLMEVLYYDEPISGITWDVFSLVGDGGYQYTSNSDLVNFGFDTTYTIDGIWECNEGEQYQLQETLADSVRGAFSQQVYQPYACTDSLGSIVLTEDYYSYSDNSYYYTYQWSNDTTGTSELAGIPPGIYSVTITDGYGCTTVFTDTLTLITDPGFSAGTGSIPVPYCQDDGTGEVWVNVQNGYKPIEIYWIGYGYGNDTLKNLHAGLYRVEVSDSLGCVINDTIRVNQSPAFAGTVPVSIVPDCKEQNNGAINITVTGGQPPLTFMWSNADTAENIAYLDSGSYSVTITDAVNCTTAATVDVPWLPGENVALNSDTISCYGLSTGAAWVTIAGGVPPYTLMWSTGASTDTVSGLSAGTYDIQVKDSNQCMVTDTVQINQSRPFSLTASYNNIACYDSTGGSVSLKVSGATPAYNYEWSNHAADSVLTNLPAGTYNCTITDANGCSITHSVTLTQPDSLSAFLSAVQSTCDASTGSVSIDSIYGGTKPYTFSWSNGSDGAVAGNLAVGLYQVTISDGNGCAYIYRDSVSCVTGIVNIAPGGSVSVYPVPASTYLYINSLLYEKYQLELRDITGQLVQQSWFTQSTVLNVASLSRGVYLAEIYNCDGALVMVRKVVLQ